MLAGYDAEAVADVLGIAFLPRPQAGRRRAAAHTPIVIYVDDAAVQVVEHSARPGRASAARKISPPSPVLIEKAVESGLPRTALRHVAESLAGGDRAKVARLEWGVVPKTTLERRETQLSPEESERTERVARLFVHARRALGTEPEARAFMTTPHPLLDGRSPIDAARTDLGTRRAEQILNAIEYGLAL